jgi:hypothetical protein
VIFFVCLFVFCFFRDRVSLYSSGCPETRFVDQNSELRNPPASASQVQGLKACATMLGFVMRFDVHSYSVIIYIKKKKKDVEKQQNQQAEQLSSL